jgi:hypothetical protein
VVRAPIDRTPAKKSSTKTQRANDAADVRAAKAAAARRKAARREARTRKDFERNDAATSRAEQTGGNKMPSSLKYARSYIGQNYLSGMCQAFVVRANGAPGGARTAAIAWQNASRAGNGHQTAPPVGASVYWTGGSSGAGHTAIVSKYVNGKPYVISTGVGGKVAEVPLSYFGGSLKYQGWASSINGKKIDVKSLGGVGGDAGPTSSYTGSQSTRGNGGDGYTNSTGMPSGPAGDLASGSSFSKKEFYAQLSEKFGDVDTMLKLDKQARDELGEGKSLKWAIDQMVKKKVTDSSIALTFLNQTAWFKKYSPEISKRLIDEKAKPERTADERAAVTANFQKILNEKGVRVPAEDMAKVVRDAHVYGWSTEQMIDAIQSAGNLEFAGGDIETQIEAVRQFADDYGVTLNAAEVRQLQTELLDNMGTQSAQDRITDAAAGKYTVFADRIRAGEDLRSITKPYWDQAAELLEVSPQSINWSDSLFKDGNAFTKTDANGMQAVKTLSEFEKEVRSDARWKTTKNARETVGNAQYDMLARFGFAS